MAAWDEEEGEDLDVFLLLVGLLSIDFTIKLAITKGSGGLDDFVGAD